jgi:hypothetical protein
MHYDKLAYCPKFSFFLSFAFVLKYFDQRLERKSSGDRNLSNPSLCSEILK